jgi:predicted outer membrane repeat protein
MLALVDRGGHLEVVRAQALLRAHIAYVVDQRRGLYLLLYVRCGSLTGGGRSLNHRGRCVMRTTATVLLVIALLSIPFFAHARTWYIKADGTGDAPTIQAGIDSAAVGDTVLVSPGTYTGAGNKNLNFGGKNLVLRSEAGPEATIIDCEGSGRGLLFYSNETSASAVEGFTIRNGDSGGREGGGILCLESSPTISNCTFSGNSGGNGGGLYCIQSSLAITNCTFSGNSAAHGGAMQLAYCAGADPLQITNCTFSGNSAGWAGGGLCLVISGPELTNCTFSGNSAGDGGGGIWCEYESWPRLQNTIIAFSTQGEAVHCDETSNPTFTCCDIFGNAGGDWVGCIAGQYGINGNISEDPLFCGEEHHPGDPYTLDIASPCAVRNSPCGQLIGARPAGCSEGVSTERTTWGRVKAMYR